MCGRFAVDADIDDLLRALAAEDGGWTDALTALPNWSLRPTDDIPVLLESVKTGAPRRVLAPARWGLVPSWSRTEKTSRPTFNARLETLAERPLWRGPLEHRRCVVPASAYYEWSGERGARTAFAIGDPGRPRMLLAGLAQWWRPSPLAPWRLTATVVTRPALGALAGIHERMPLALPAELAGEWIAAGRRGDQAFADAIAAAAEPTARELVATEVERVPPAALPVG